MYDLLTTVLLFLLLTPGVLLSLPSSTHGDITTAIIHALVFWIILRFLSGMIPWWMIWIAATVLVGYKVTTPSSSGT
jgi:glucan phosphoethanolaminetransferase (alkaline phosphatase superfamily)